MSIMSSCFNKTIFFTPGYFRFAEELSELVSYQGDVMTLCDVTTNGFGVKEARLAFTSNLFVI